jgi:hypothetical protein
VSELFCPETLPVLATAALLARHLLFALPHPNGAVEDKSVVVVCDFRFLARLLNCQGCLFETTMITMTMELFDERSLPTLYPSRRYAIN